MTSRSAIFLAASALWFSGISLGQVPCPSSPPVVASDPQLPTDVCLPGNVSGVPFQFFDDFSWRSFIALVWPAQSGERGVPDTSKQVGGTGFRVFETYKQLPELFHNDGSAPSDWNSFDMPKQNPCNVQMALGDLVLASFSKFSNLGQAGFGTLVGPLVAQNRTYTRYLTAFNRIEFDDIRNNRWYLRANIPQAGVTFRNGSIDIKSAWIDMTGKDPLRFYTRMAWLQDPQTNTCSQKLVGLVGLHIVQKTPSRPQWIWSTFEHVDNVEEAGAHAPFTFNSADGTPMPQTNPYKVNPLPLPTPAPFNVTRIQKISTSTQATNEAYQTALAGTPWRFYQLVMTQWPVCGNPPCDPKARGTPENTFPGAAATTAFANTTMESFEQNNISTGCMACHNVTQTVMAVNKGTDFVWSLRDHAFQPTVPNVLLTDSSFKTLQTILKNSKIPKDVSRSAAQRNKADAQRNK
jgi:hypothetical protein